MPAGRIALVLAIGLTAVTLLALNAGVAPMTETAPAAFAAPPVALFDLGGIFGDENEADEDENEPEEDAGAARKSRQGSGISFPTLLLALGAGLLGVRLVLRRLRAWLQRAPG